MPNQLDINFVRHLIGNYGTHHWNTLLQCPTVQQNPNKEDTRCVWHSLAELKGFIKAIEDAIQKNGLDQATLKPGIRFYFAENPTDPMECNTYGVDPHFAGLHSLVMVPTYHDATIKTNHDFDPNQINAANQPLDLTTVPNGNIMAMNHGTTLPPPYLSNRTLLGMSLMVV